MTHVLLAFSLMNHHQINSSLIFYLEEQFLDDMTVTADTEKNYDGRDNYRTYDYAESS